MNAEKWRSGEVERGKGERIQMFLSVFPPRLHPSAFIN